MSNTPDTTERKAMLTQVCDADNYLPIITACLDETQTKKLKPRHMANFMALAAELFISNYSMIAEAFERNNGLEIGFKAKLAQEKDNVEIQFKPVDVFKDSASANLPDEDQEEFPFVKKSTPQAASGGVTVEAEILSLPAPASALPDKWPADLAEDTLRDYLLIEPELRAGFLDDILCDGTGRGFVDHVLDNLDRLNEMQTLAFALAMARNQNSGSPKELYGQETMQLAELAVNRMVGAKKKAEREKVLRMVIEGCSWDVLKAAAVILLSEAGIHPVDAELRTAFLGHVEERAMDLDGEAQED